MLHLEQTTQDAVRYQPGVIPFMLEKATESKQ